MIFKKDIEILQKIKSQEPKLPNDFYDYNDIFHLSGMEQDEYLMCLRNLAKEEIISFGDKSQTAFRLEENGLYFKEYQKKKFIEYVMDKLVDFLALVVAIIALIISIA